MNYENYERLKPQIEALIESGRIQRHVSAKGAWE